MGVDVGRDEVAAREHYEATKDRTLAACVDTEPTALRECVVKAAEAAQSQSEARQDLYAQQDMSKWAFLMMIISGLTFLATLLGIVCIRDTLIETRRAVKSADDAVKVTREIGQAQVRAYISASNASISMVDTGEIRIHYTLTNTGQSPARNVTFRAGAKISHVDHFSAEEASTVNLGAADGIHYGVNDICSGMSEQAILTFGKDQASIPDNDSIVIFASTVIEFETVFPDMKRQREPMMFMCSVTADRFRAGEVFSMKVGSGEATGKD